MTTREKSIIKTYLIDYLKFINPAFKITGRKNLFQCPICDKEDTANIFPVESNKICCMDPVCGFRGDIFELIKKTKQSLAEADDETIIEYIKYKLKVEIKDNTQDLLKKYEDAGFALIKVRAGDDDPGQNKRPIDNDWQKSEHRNPTVWKDWLDAGFNIGLNLGTVSQCIAVDVDSDEAWEKIESLVGETLIQSTLKGKHLIYKYDPDFDKTYNLRRSDESGKSLPEWELEIRSNNAQIVIAPSSVGGETRAWGNGKIIEMPKELKEFLLENIDKKEKHLEPDDEIQKAIDEEKLNTIDLSGRRNDTFVKTAGVFSKWIPKEANFKVMSFLSNNWIDKPIPRRELTAMLEQIKKYRTYDKEELAKTVLDRLDIIGEGTAFQISKSLSLEQKDVEEVLKHLEVNNKIISIGRNRYKKLIELEWEKDFTNLGVPVDFEVPYFHQHARFDKGNMIIIGGKSGTGKTHITANILKKLVDQKIHPYLISTEAGSKVGKICKQLGLKIGDFSFKNVKNPTDIELKDNAVTVIDWLKPKGGDYAKTDATFEELNTQLVKHSGFLIVLVQIRKDGSFFAPDQIDFYASLVAKYQYKTNEGKIDNKNTYFETTKIRDSRTGMQYITIPTEFDNDTKVLELQNG